MVSGGCASGWIGENERAFGIGEFAPAAWYKPETGQGQRANPFAVQAQGRMTDCGRHATNLAVFPFGEFKREPAIRHGFAHANGRVAWRDVWRWIEPPGATREGLVFAQTQAVGKLAQALVGGDVFDLDPIFATVTVARMKKTFVYPGLVGQ